MRIPRPGGLARGLLVALLAVVTFVFCGWLAVRIAVSGPTQEVPDVVGLSRDEAVSRLEETGLTAQVDERRLPVHDLPADAVARQEPGPGTSVKRMRAVRLLLAQGPRNVELPTMVGDSRSRALIALSQQGFEVDYTAEVHSSEVPRDRIIEQEPNPAELPPGTTVPVRLLVSLGAGPRHYVMPDLIRTPAARARPWLERHGFRVTEGPDRRVIANVPAGTIISQSPPAGFRIAAGSEITLRVSR